MICETCNGTGEINDAPIVDNSNWDNIGDCPNCTGRGCCPNCGVKWGSEILSYYRLCVKTLHINKFVCPLCEWQGGEVWVTTSKESNDG